MKLNLIIISSIIICIFLGLVILLAYLYKSRWPLYMSLINESSSIKYAVVFLNDTKYKSYKLIPKSTPVNIYINDLINPRTEKIYTRGQAVSVTIAISNEEITEWQVFETQKVDKNNNVIIEAPKSFDGNVVFDKGNLPISSIKYAKDFGGCSRISNNLWGYPGYYIMEFNSGIPLF